MSPVFLLLGLYIRDIPADARINGHFRSAWAQAPLKTTQASLTGVGEHHRTVQALDTPECAGPDARQREPAPKNASPRGRLQGSIRFCRNKKSLIPNWWWSCIRILCETWDFNNSSECICGYRNNKDVLEINTGRCLRTRICRSVR